MCNAPTPLMAIMSHSLADAVISAMYSPNSLTTRINMSIIVVIVEIAAPVLVPLPPAARSSRPGPEPAARAPLPHQAPPHPH